MAGRREEWDDVKAAVKATVWFAMKMTDQGWKRNGGGDSIMPIQGYLFHAIIDRERERELSKV